MKELINIVAAFEEANRLGKKTALATVVNVNGSSYRRPGARMLVTEEGMLTGTISGGCLEGDALRKAVLAITQGKNKLVVYDTSDEEDAKVGVQLGCNGIVTVLFEPILAENFTQPISVLQTTLLAERKSSLLFSSYSINHKEHFGTRQIDQYPSAIQKQLNFLAEEVTTNQQSRHIEMVIENNEQHFFIEYLKPPISLVIVGAGNDALPLVAMAEMLGWPVTLIDGRKTHASAKRFPTVKKISIGKPADIINQIIGDNRTALVLMTHNYQYDKEMLECLLGKGFAYIGMLGPSSRRDRMLEELTQKGVTIAEQYLQHVYGPTGLDLGAETADEIALSICSEIMAVMNKKNPIHLKERTVGIHHPNI